MIFRQTFFRITTERSYFYHPTLLRRRVRFKYFSILVTFEFRYNITVRIFNVHLSPSNLRFPAREQRYRILHRGHTVIIIFEQLVFKTTETQNRFLNCVFFFLSRFLVTETKKINCFSTKSRSNSTFNETYAV